MKSLSIHIILFCFILNITALPLLVAKPVDLSKSMKQSLVYLEISISQYDQHQPWKRSSISKEGGFGCAVGPYEILTTAENIIHATLVQARRYDQNALVNATVKIVDYEYNLCLLELDQSELNKPFKPIKFSESFPKKETLQIYWLSSTGHLTTAAATLDRAQMISSEVSFTSNLTFFATNTSRPFGDGELCCYGKKAIGIARWGTDSDSGIIPSESINRFLSLAKKDTYNGFASVGFDVYSLLDPTMRKFLQLPTDQENGVYVSSVNTVGTGSRELKAGDVILSIDGNALNAYGRYKHPIYDRISFDKLILELPVGSTIPFEIHRDGKTINVDVEARGVKSDNMLIPYYSYGIQPEYIVLGGFMFQALTRDYLSIWGSDWTGKVPPHLLHYYLNESFKPSPDREDVVILSYVLPTPMNQGYQQLSQLVVDTLNGVKVKSFQQFIETINTPTNREIFEITFEMDGTTLIIPKDQLDQINLQISQIYDIPKLSNVNQ